MNIILNPDRTFKNIVSVDEAVARSAECPIDILDADVFVENAPLISAGMHTPRLLENWRELLDADPAVQVWEEANPAQFAADLASQNILRIKAKAGQVITARIPEWKQRNMLARKSELQDVMLSGGTLSADEQAEWDFMMAEWVWCKSVRTASDQAENNNTPVEEIVWPS